MMKNHLSRFLILGFTLSILSVGAQADTYVIDKAHSEVTFKVKHLGISNVAGRFNNFEGSIDYNPDAIHESAVSATIEIASLDTANEHTVLYRLVTDDEPVADPEEIEYVEYKSLVEISEMLTQRRDDFSPPYRIALDWYIERFGTTAYE